MIIKNSTQIPISRSILLDGSENDLINFSQRYDLDAMEHLEISFKAFDNKLDLLKEIVEDREFNTFVKQLNALKSKLLGAYKSSSGLNLYYAVLKSSKNYFYIVVVSYGEIQPGRYNLWIEGIWKTLLP